MAENPLVFSFQAMNLDGTPCQPEFGMELRDWFAGQIASGMAAHSGTAGAAFGPGDIAARSYEVADALLSTREKGGTRD